MRLNLALALPVPSLINLWVQRSNYVRQCSLLRRQPRGAELPKASPDDDYPKRDYQTGGLGNSDDGCAKKTNRWEYVIWTVLILGRVSAHNLPVIVDVTNTWQGPRVGKADYTIRSIAIDPVNMLVTTHIGDSHDLTGIIDAYGDGIYRSRRSAESGE